MPPRRFRTQKKTRRLNKRKKNKRTRKSSIKRRRTWAGTKLLNPVVTTALKDAGQQVVKAVRRTNNPNAREMATDIATGVPGQLFTKRNPENSKAVKSLLFGVKSNQLGYQHDQSRFPAEMLEAPKIKIDSSFKSFAPTTSKNQEAIRKILAETS